MKKFCLFVLACTSLTLTACNNDSRTASPSEEDPFLETTVETSDPNTIKVIPSEIFENVEKQLTEIAGDQYELQSFKRDEDNRNGEGFGINVSIYYSGTEYSVEDVLNHLNSFVELVNQNLKPILGLRNVWISNQYLSTHGDCTPTNPSNEEEWKIQVSTKYESDVNLEDLNWDRTRNGLAALDTSHHPDYNAKGEYDPVAGKSNEEMLDEMGEIIENNIFGY